MYHTLFSLFILFLQAGSLPIEEIRGLLLTSPTFAVTTITTSLITTNRHPTLKGLKRSASYPPHNPTNDTMKIIQSSNNNMVDEFKHIGQYLSTIDENKQVNKLPNHAASSSPPPLPPKDWYFRSRNNTKDNAGASSSFKDQLVPKNYTVLQSTASSSSCEPPSQKKECMICFDDYEEEDIFYPKQCQHYSCRQCLTTYLTKYTEVHHDDYTKIPCPGYQCKDGSFDSQDIVSRVMSSTAADAWWFKVIRRDILESYVSGKHALPKPFTLLLTQFRAIVLIAIARLCLSWMK